MNNPFDYIPDETCQEAFKKLLERIEELKKSDRQEEISFIRELEAGKMLGVLIASDSKGNRHVLYAFSGQLGDEGFYFPGFVPPVFDYLLPDGYFKTKEADISRQNIVIDNYERGILEKTKTDYDRVKNDYMIEITSYKEKIRLSKMERDNKRIKGITDEENKSLIRQSQFEKAELVRIKRRMAIALGPKIEELEKAKTTLECMKEKRRKDSENLQAWLFSNFKLLNARGESKSLKEIFEDTSVKVPPSGAGECCAPKLLQVAYLKGWYPLSIAEYWYGKSKSGEVRIHGEYYPACRGKCFPVLSWMLQGLDIIPPLDTELHRLVTPEPEIIYENQWFCVINKPSGMLSVPGKGSGRSVEEWLSEKYGDGRFVRMAHRLDQDTSGLIIAAFSTESYKELQSLFARRLVKKTYVADLEGNYESIGLPRKGRIELPLSPDWYDRPRQRVDLADGKEAITDYEFIDVSKGVSRIKFHPLTGRTHQLRVHAASEKGLGMPIVGDRLYGKNTCKVWERLYLHAWEMDFTFPMDGHHYHFMTPVTF